MSVTSVAKMTKMQSFVPDYTARGNGNKVHECYQRLLSCENSAEVFAVMSDFGGTLGYKTVAYLMEYVRIGQEPPASYFGQEAFEPTPGPKADELYPGLDLAFLRELGLQV